MKKISVSVKNWRQLMRIKTEKGFSTANEAIGFLVEKPDETLEQKSNVAPHTLFEDITDDIDRIIQEKKP